MNEFVTFRCTTASGKTKVISVRRPKFVIGRAEDCDMRIALPDVSRRHCLVELSEFGVAFTDMRPQRPEAGDAQPELRQYDVHNGKGMLNVGDELFIGSTRLVLENYAGYAAVETQADAAGDQVQLTDSTLMPAIHPGLTRTQLAFSPLSRGPGKNSSWDGILKGALDAPKRPVRDRVWLARDNMWRCCILLLGTAALVSLTYLIYLLYKRFYV